MKLEEANARWNKQAQAKAQAKEMKHRDVVLVALPVSTPNLPVSVWYLFGKIETYQL